MKWSRLLNKLMKNYYFLQLSHPLIIHFRHICMFVRQCDQSFLQCCTVAGLKPVQLLNRLSQNIKTHFLCFSIAQGGLVLRPCKLLLKFSVMYPYYVYYWIVQFFCSKKVVYSNRGLRFTKIKSYALDQFAITFPIKILFS